jgi:hypothetical protein
MCDAWRHVHCACVVTRYIAKAALEQIPLSSFARAAALLLVLAVWPARVARSGAAERDEASDRQTSPTRGLVLAGAAGAAGGAVGVPPW